MLQKRNEKLLTYKNNKSHPGGPPYTRNNYETLDYVLVPRRWRNAVKNIESDINSGFDSDHYPLLAHIVLNLKAKHEKDTKRWEYDICAPDQRQMYNTKLANKHLASTAAFEAIPKKEKLKHNESLSSNCSR